MKLIVGLGNPGKMYEHTRHNVGFRVVEHLSFHLDAGKLVKNDKFHAAISDAQIKDERVTLAKPLTFMNASGEAVAALKRFYKIESQDILVIHDEMDFPVGRLSFAMGGGNAGHNGIASVIDSLGTDAFARLRIGIARPKHPMKKEYYVLIPPDDDETAKMNLVEEKAVEASYDWIVQGIDKAMDTWNGVKSD